MDCTSERTCHREDRRGQERDDRWLGEVEGDFRGNAGQLKKESDQVAAVVVVIQDAVGEPWIVGREVGDRRIALICANSIGFSPPQKGCQESGLMKRKTRKMAKTSQNAISGPPIEVRMIERIGLSWLERARSNQPRPPIRMRDSTDQTARKAMISRLERIQTSQAEPSQAIKRASPEAGAPIRGKSSRAQGSPGNEQPAEHDAPPDQRDKRIARCRAAPASVVDDWQRTDRFVEHQLLQRLRSAQQPRAEQVESLRRMGRKVHLT